MGNSASAPAQCAPGCSPTSAVSQAISQVQAARPNVTPDPVSQCQANKISASNLQTQLNQANSAVDQCDPSVPLARTENQLEQQNQQFVQQSQSQSNVLSTSVQDKFRIGNDLAEAVKELKHYEKKLREELETAEKGSMKLEHDERKYRRDFLDSQPTEGVPWHIFGLQTSDDKVMLTFWITAFITFSLLAHITLTTLMPNESLKDRAIKGTIGVVIALLCSYLLITYKG